MVDGNAYQENGPSLCTAVKERSPSTAILHTTRKGEDLARASAEGKIDGYLIEPFNPLELVSLVRSLLTLRRAEAALRDAEARLQLAQDAGRLAVFDWNLLTGRAIWSDKFAELFQLPKVPRISLSSRTISAVVCILTTGQASPNITNPSSKAVVISSATFACCRRRARSIGSRRAASSSRGRRAGSRRILCLSLDITERKQADLRNAQLAAIVASSIDAIVSVDFSDTILTWNSGAEQLFAYTAQEVLGRKADFLVPPELLPERHAIMQRLMSGEAIEYQTRRLRKDGAAIDVWIRGAPVSGLDGSSLAAR